MAAGGHDVSTSGTGFENIEQYYSFAFTANIQEQKDPSTRLLVQNPHKSLGLVRIVKNWTNKLDLKDVEQKISALK